jgi:poly [ADP-ribose] polymerase 2/3/4
MSLGSSTKPVVPLVTAAGEMAPSKLDTNVQDFVKLIFNKKLMEESVVKIGYDVKKMPLGELSKDTVLKGY